jgi:hypothetical protein
VLDERFCDPWFSGSSLQRFSGPGVLGWVGDAVRRLIS